MTISEYFSRPDSEKILLATITYSGGTLYLADRPYITEPTDTPANRLFEPMIQASGIPEFRQSIQELTGGRSERSAGSLKLVTADYNGVDIRTLVLRGAAIELRIAAPRRLFSYADSVLWLQGIIGTSKGGTDGRVNYEITDRQRVLESITIPQNLYTAGAGVPSDLVSRPKPLAYGLGSAPMFLVDSVNLVYQIHDGALSTGIFDGLVALRDDGNLLRAQGSCTVSSPPTNTVVFGTWASTEDDFYNDAEWIGLAPLPAAIRTVTDYDGATRTATLNSNVTLAHTECSVDLFVADPTTGTARVFAQPAGVISGEFTSLADRSTIPLVVEHLATTFGGMLAADVDVSTAGVAISLWFDDETALADIFTALARGEFAWWGFDRSDKLVMKPISPPALPADHTVAFEDFARDSVTWSESDEIVWKVTQLNQRNWIDTGSAALAEADEVFRGREVGSDAAVKTTFDDAVTRTLQSYSLVGTTAIQRTLDFFKVRRFVVDGRLPFAGDVFDVGQTIDITGVPEPINSPLLITDVRGRADGSLQLGMIG